MATGSRLRDLYSILYNHFGPQNWWPGDTPFEVLDGAVLTQNTNWNNVSQAIKKLKEAHLLKYESLHSASVETIAE